MVSSILLQKKYAGIAQSVEQLIRNQQVVCSSHITSSTQSRTPVGVRLCVFIFAAESAGERDAGKDGSFSGGV